MQSFFALHMKKLFLLDSSAVLNDFNFSFGKESEYATTPEIISEFRDLRSRALVDSALQQGIVSILSPAQENTDFILKLAAEHGFQRLSRQDISLLSLAVQFKNHKKRFTVITDDYSIQNFCKLLKINFEGVLHEKIKKVISYKTVCANCGKEFPNDTNLKKCDVCNSRLKKLR